MLFKILGKRKEPQYKKLTPLCSGVPQLWQKSDPEGY
jgi:hypothetical protein